MSKKNKEWGNQPSRQGLGILQDFLGVPNSAHLSKGDLLLKQQEKITKVQEAIADQLSNADYRTIAVAPDNSEIMARVESKIVDGLRAVTESFADMAHYPDVDFNSLEETLSKHASVSQEELQRIRNISENVAEDVSRMSGSLDYLSDEIPKGFNTLGKIGRQQADLLGKIAEKIDSNGQNNESMLTGIAQLIIGQAKLAHEDAELSRVEIRDAISQATTEIVSGLFQIQQEISQGFDRVKHSIDLNTQAVDRNTREISQEIADQTSAIRYNAENSEIIKASQYKTQGIELYKRGHFQEALNRLKIAFSLCNTDFETNFLLSRINIKNGDLQSAKKHLELAKSFSTVNQNSCALSLVEFAKIGDIDSASNSAAHLLNNFDIISLDKGVYNELLAHAKLILPILKQQSQSGTLSSHTLFNLSALFFTVDVEIEFARRVLVKGYKLDSKIQMLRDQSNFLGIVRYLENILGKQLVRIKKFGEFPLELRSLIK